MSPLMCPYNIYGVSSSCGYMHNVAGRVCCRSKYLNGEYCTDGTQQQGDTCGEDKYCDSSTFCNNAQQCEAKFDNTVQYCSRNEQCLSGICVGNICCSNWDCDAQQIGERCYTTSNCAGSNWCNNGVCAAALQPNIACTADEQCLSDMCRSFSVGSRCCRHSQTGHAIGNGMEITALLHTCRPVVGLLCNSNHQCELAPSPPPPPPPSPSPPATSTTTSTSFSSTTTTPALSKNI